MRLFLISTLVFLFFSPFAYALRPSSTEEIGGFKQEEKDLSEITKARTEEFKKEKKDLIEDAMPLREKRRITLHPFVQEVKMADFETEGAIPSDIKGVYAPLSVDLNEPKKAEPPIRRSVPGYAASLIFLSLLIGAFLASYFFIRPRSK